MKSPTNLSDVFNSITEHFSPKIIGAVNDVYIKLVIIKGDKVPWHRHKEEDELFLIIEGSLVIETENTVPIHMNKGDLYIVPQGVNHKVWSVDECSIMLIENKTTLHTGEVISHITKTIAEQKNADKT